MEKRITLIMQRSKDIVVKSNSYSLTIKREQRSIRADDIYKLLTYSRGDTYTIESDNEDNLDVAVLSYFTELFQDIACHLNNMTHGHEHLDVGEAEWWYQGQSGESQFSEDDNLPF